MVFTCKLFSILIIIANEMSAIFGNNMQKMSFKPPRLTEEDEKSDHMPDYFKCEACVAIAYQVSAELTKYHEKFRNKPQLKEMEILDIFETILENGFEMYGVKSVSGVKYLTGPGLPVEKEAGIVQMGGKWSKRLKSLLGFYLGEVGEDVIYQAYLENKQPLDRFLCHGNQYIPSQCESQNKLKHDL